MKANEAPWKIYVALDEIDEGGRTFVLDHRIDYPICTEYTRTDAFMKKACEWLRESITNHPECYRIVSKKGEITMGLLIEDFRNYMKGE